jgi:hypothetical protein
LAAESTAAESASHGVPAHPTMRAHPAMRAHTTTTTTTASAAAARRRNGWGKGDHRTDCNGGGESHDALSEHGPVPP